MRAILKRVLFWQKRSTAGSEYQLWRQKLIRQRLKICLWLAIPCLTTYTIHSLYDNNFDFNNPWILANLISLLFLFICIVIYQTKWSKHHLKWLFVLISLGFTCVPNIITIALGTPTPSAILLNMVFVTQTVFVPFFWGLHLITQLGGLICYWLSVRLRGSLPNIMLYENLSTIYWFWICFICTSAVYLYERLQQKEFESRRELKIFLHSITHDLRTPTIGSSIVLQNLLKQSGQQLTIDRSILERLHQGSDRQVKMINSLIEAHQTEVNGIAIVTEFCQINAIVNSVITDLQPLLIQHQAKIDNRIPKNLPQIRADFTQLWRVYSNLITNALKHNPPGIEVLLDASRQDLCLYCTVKDNGVGIPAEQSERLFALYSRGKRARYMPGLGLGLYLCRQIVNAHGGDIGFDSYSGRGTTFWFTVPILKYSIGN